MENLTLGQLIGKVEHTCSIKNDAGDKVQLRVSFDFSTSSNDDVKAWLAANRTIALQRPTRAMSAEEIKGLSGTVIMAVDAGKKVKSLTERKAEAKATMAALKANFPEEYEAVMEEMGHAKSTSDIVDEIAEEEIESI